MTDERIIREYLTAAAQAPLASFAEVCASVADKSGLDAKRIRDVLQDYWYGRGAG